MSMWVGEGYIDPMLINDQTRDRLVRQTIEAFLQRPIPAEAAGVEFRLHFMVPPAKPAT
jgi:hypothetical protein